LLSVAGLQRPRLDEIGGHELCELIEEFELDLALDGSFGRIRHGGRLVRIRLDLEPADVTTGRAEARHDHTAAVGPLAEAGRR
jgi:hypothetical protein